MKNLRWWIAGVIYLGMAVNYLDRQVLSVLAPEIRDAFHLTNTDYARIVFAFQLSYMISSGAGGRLVDYLGIRIGYLLMMVFWSAASLLHALSTGAVSLLCYRFLLGMGEGGAFPAAAKAMAEWFPRRERALAVGFINGSLSLGGILAPPLTAFIALRFGWRSAFVVIGALGFLWLAAWLPLYRSPREHPRLRKEEREWIESDTVAESGSGAPVRVGKLLRLPQIWGRSAARFVADPPWQFYMFWLPEYLKRVRGMGLAEIGMLAWIPFLAAAFGSVLGGWGSGYLIRRRMSPVRARKVTMAASAALLPAGVLAALAPSGGWAVAWVCVAGVGHMAWVSNVQTLPSDVVPSSMVGTVVGLSQTTAYLGNLAATLATGYVIDRFSYFPVFCVAGVLHPLATIILLLTFVRLGTMARRLSVSGG
jgi:ACS family hexuronate transporter-like MFS transporter